MGNFTDQNGLFENGIVTQYTGRMTTVIRNWEGTVGAEEGWKLWNEYQGRPKEEKAA